MKTFTTCMQCQADTGVPNFGSFGLARIPDDGVIEVTCDRGHLTYNLIQEAKHEILSELAVSALQDGYYREAIASFASALERLYEHFVDVACRARNVDREAFLSSWKPSRKASERQLGAFSLVYLIETGQATQLLPDKQVSFRNNVIHAGMIPDRDQAVAYGQAVGDCAWPLIELLHSERYERARSDFIFDSLREKSKRAEEVGARYSTQTIATPFGFNTTARKFDLETVLAERAARPNFDEAVTQSHAIARFIAGLMAGADEPAQGGGK